MHPRHFYKCWNSPLFTSPTNCDAHDNRQTLFFSGCICPWCVTHSVTQWLASFMEKSPCLLAFLCCSTVLYMMMAILWALPFLAEHCVVKCVYGCFTLFKSSFCRSNHFTGGNTQTVTNSWLRKRMESWSSEKKSSNNQLKWRSEAKW